MESTSYPLNTMKNPLRLCLDGINASTGVLFLHKKRDARIVSCHLWSGEIMNRPNRFVHQCFVFHVARLNLLEQVNDMFLQIGIM